MRSRRPPAPEFHLLTLLVAVTGLLVACSSQAAAPIECPEERPFVGQTADGTSDVWFCSGSVGLAASLYEPETAPVAAVVFVHGDGEVPRLKRENPVVSGLVKGGVAVLTYDKRGAGSSQGSCCPGDDGEFTELIADAEAAIRSLAEISPYSELPMGIYGESQAAWVAPAASRNAGTDFLILVSAPPISFAEEILHEELTDQGLDQETIRQRLAEVRPSGADPRADISGLPILMLWIFGAEDAVIPVEYSRQVLAELASAHQLDVTDEVLAGGGHSLIHHSELFPRVFDWLAERVGISARF